MAYVATSRRAMLFGEEPVFKNVSIAILERLSRWLLKPDRERAIAEAQVKSLDIRPPHIEARLGGLSGGNQQKVALAKWLTHPPRILLLAEPTRGMDVGAKEDVVKIVRALRDQGIAIVVFSTEPETVLSLADRVLVMRKGAIAREVGDGAKRDGREQGRYRRRRQAPASARRFRPQSTAQYRALHYSPVPRPVLQH